MNKQDLKAEALVLKRTNYGEADRILNVLTPEGKKAILAKGVRKEKSRLASGVEIFSLSELTLHRGRGELAILTGAKPKRFYRNLLADVGKLGAAGEILKIVSKKADNIESEDFFEITKQSIEALNDGADIELVLAWFYLNLARVGGEQINLSFDADEEALAEGSTYSWDSTEKLLRKNASGKISTYEIKMMRLMLVGKIALILRVSNADIEIPEILFIAKSLNQI